MTNTMKLVLSRALREGITGELLRYLVAGGVAFAVDYGTLMALQYGLGTDYLAAAAAGFAIGLAVNYIISVTWVFKKRKLKSRRTELIFFSAVGLAGLGINELMLWIVTGMLGVPTYFAKPAAQVIVLAWNFGARKLLLFGGNKDAKKD